MLFSFSGCNLKAEIVNPNESIIESDSEIKIEPNTEGSSVLEKEPENGTQTNVSENKYIVTEIEENCNIFCEISLKIVVFFN